MDPFHVTCETCHARLKIRSDSVIGQIHSCPKCESMVHIVPPLGWKPPQAVGSGAAGATAAVADEAVVPMAAAPAPVGFPAMVWWIGGAVAAAVLGVTALFFALGGEKEVAHAPVVAVVPPEAKQEDAAPPAVEEVEESVAEVDVPSKEVAADGVARDDAPAGDDAMAAVVEAPASSEPFVASSVDPQNAEVGAVGNAPVAEATSPPEATAPPKPIAGQPAPVLKFDPLDFDPAQLSLGAATGEVPATQPGSVPANGAATLGNDPSAADVPADVSADDILANDSAEENPSVTVRVGPPSTDAVRPRDVAKQLATRVQGFEAASMPLPKFLQVVGNMADVSITLPPAALATAGISPRAEVAVRSDSTTLEKLLRDTLVKQRLDFVAVNGQVSVVPRGGDRQRTVDYDVQDLLAPGTDAAALVPVIKQLVAPGAWRGAGAAIEAAGSKLHVVHEHDVQVQVLVFCERLRLARGLSPRSRYPVERLSIDSPHGRIAAALGRPTTFTFLPWTRLGDVVRHWQEASGVTMLVDWQALAAEELAPSTPVACSAIRRPWREALDEVLGPLGLGWWAVDGETIQITTPAAMAQVATIEFYSVPSNLRDKVTGDKAASIEGLMETLGEELRERTIVADSAPTVMTTMRLDEPSGRLIVLTSPAGHRYLSERPRDADAVTVKASVAE